MNEGFDAFSQIVVGNAVQDFFGHLQTERVLSRH